MLRMVLAENIKKLRKESGLTQTHLANWLELSVSQISAVETGRSMPTAEQLFIMSRAFGIDDMNLFYQQ